MPVDSQRKFVTKGFAFLLIQNRAFVFLPLFPPRRPLTLSVRRLSCVYSSIEEIPLSPRCPLQIFPLIFVNFRKFPSALEKKKIERKTRSNSKFLPPFFPPIDRNDFKRRRRRDVGMERKRFRVTRLCGPDTINPSFSPLFCVSQAFYTRSHARNHPLRGDRPFIMTRKRRKGRRRRARGTRQVHQACTQRYERIPPEGTLVLGTRERDTSWPPAGIKGCEYHPGLPDLVHPLRRIHSW